MNLKEQLQLALANAAPFSLGELTIEVSDGAQQFHCELTALDSLACAFQRLTLASDGLRRLTSEQLRGVAEQLSRRLTYLLEPISPIETDAQGCVVQMRSNPPHRDTDSTSYYELLVARAGQLTLVRYARAVGQSRQAVPAHVTREVLLRLAGDLSAAAG